MPILGTVASQFSGKSFGSFESIQTVTVGAGGASSIEFTSIPSTYKHLQIRYLGQTARSDFNGDALGVRVNSDSGNNYSFHILRMREDSSSGIVTETGASQSVINFGYGSLVGSTNSSIFFAAGVVDILDYKSTNKTKVFRNLYGYELNSTSSIGSVFSVVGFASGAWLNTNAITSISLLSVATGQNFKQYSSFALYGIKGS
jgi:hypothetical protein